MIAQFDDNYAQDAITHPRDDVLGVDQGLIPQIDVVPPPVMHKNGDTAIPQTSRAQTGQMMA